MKKRPTTAVHKDTCAIVRLSHRAPMLSMTDWGCFGAASVVTTRRARDAVRATVTARAAVLRPVLASISSRPACAEQQSTQKRGLVGSKEAVKWAGGERCKFSQSEQRGMARKHRPPRSKRPPWRAPEPSSSRRPSSACAFGRRSVVATHRSVGRVGGTAEDPSTPCQGLLVKVNTYANGSVQHFQPHPSAFIHKPWLLRTFSAPEVAEPPALAAWRGRTEMLSSAGTARLTSAARATAMPRSGTDD